MRIVFLGSGAFGVPTLAALHARHTLVGVVTQPDKPAGRGGTMTATPVAQWTSTHAPLVPMHKPEMINDPHAREAVRALQADAWVVIAYGQYLGTSLLENRFAINLHASLLPRWRGAGPIHAAVLAGDETSGNSVITIAPKMDAGDVLGHTTRAILPELTTGQLHDQLADDGPALVERVLMQHHEGTLVHTAQDERLVTIAPKLSKADGMIDLARRTAEKCRRTIHGLNPWPGAAVGFRGETLKLWTCAVVPGEGTPGTVLDAELGVMACANGSALRLLTVQPAGGKAMAWDAFARGRRVQRGEAFSVVQPTKSGPA